MRIKIIYKTCQKSSKLASPVVPPSGPVAPPVVPPPGPVAPPSGPGPVTPPGITPGGPSSSFFSNPIDEMRRKAECKAVTDWLRSLADKPTDTQITEFATTYNLSEDFIKNCIKMFPKKVARPPVVPPSGPVAPPSGPGPVAPPVVPPSGPPGGPSSSPFFSTPIEEMRKKAKCKAVTDWLRSLADKPTDTQITEFATIYNLSEDFIKNCIKMFPKKVVRPPVVPPLVAPPSGPARPPNSLFDTLEQRLNRIRPHTAPQDGNDDDDDDELWRGGGYRKTQRRHNNYYLK